MRTIKYIISTLLVFLSFVNVNAESYYTSHYFEVNVDGKSIDDDFYVTFLQCTADLEMISRATIMNLRIYLKMSQFGIPLN